MKKSTFLLLSCLLTLAVNGLGLSVSANAQTILKLGHVSSERGPIGLGAQRFADALSELSAGKMQVQIGSRGAFGGLNEHWAQLRTGSLDMTVIDVPAIAMVKEARAVSVLSTPFLFRDREHMRAFGNSDQFKSWMEALEKDTSIRFIGHVSERAPRVISTISKPVKSVDDIKGLKIRVPPAPVLIKTFKTWGAIPTPIKPADMFMSMKTGVVDGNEVDVLAVAFGSTIKVAKHLTPIDYTRASIGAWMSSENWQKLSAEEQAWVTQAAQAAGEKSWAAYDEQFSLAMKKIQDQGIQIHQPDIESFHFVTEKIVSDLEGKVWPKGMVSSIRQMK